MATGNPPSDLVLAFNKISALLVLSKLLLMDSLISRNSFSQVFIIMGKAQGYVPQVEMKMNRAFSWIYSAEFFSS